MKKLMLITFSTLALFSSTSFGQGVASYSGYVARIGCHNVDGTCYVSLKGPNGAIFSINGGCANNGDFRFENSDTNIGLRTYNSFLTAYQTGSMVDIAVSGCTNQNFPKLIYYNVHR